jgi:hypothetical protein
MARSSILEQLIVEITSDNTKLQRGLRDAERSTTASAANIARATQVAAAATVAVGTAFVAAANRAAQYADEVDKAAIRTRLSRGAVQELRFVTDQLGGSFSTIETAVVGLTQRLAGVEQGSERQSEAFRRLGVSVRDANGNLRDTEAIFFDAVGALQGVTNETERAVLAQEVFGRSAAQLAPVLAAGAGSVDELRKRARELGIVLGDQSVSDLVAYKDQLSALQQQFGALTREVSIAFLPVLTEGVLPAVQGALTAFRGLPEPVQRGATALTGFATAAGAALTALRLLGIPLAGLFGPAGLIIAGVGIVASLALALGGRGDRELVGAVNKARAALAGGDANSLTGALDAVAAKVDDPLKSKLVELQEELKRTGTIGVEEAQRIAGALAAAANAPLLAERARLTSERDRLQQGLASAGNLLTAEGDAGFARARRDEIITEFGPVLDAGGLLPIEVQRELQQLNEILDGVATDARVLARAEANLARERERLASITARIAQIDAELVGAVDVPTGARGTPTGSGGSVSGASAPAAPDDARSPFRPALPFGNPVAGPQPFRQEFPNDPALAARRAFRQSVIDAPILRAEDFDARLAAERDEIDALIARAQADIAVGIARRAREAAQAASAAPILRAETFDALLRAEQDEVDALIARSQADIAVASARRARETAQAIAAAPILRAEDLDARLRAEQDEVDGLIARAQAQLAANAQRRARELAAAVANAPLLRAQDFDEQLRREREEIDRLSDQGAGNAAIGRARALAEAEQRLGLLRAEVARYTGTAIAQSEAWIGELEALIELLPGSADGIRELIAAIRTKDDEDAAAAAGAAIIESGQKFLSLVQTAGQGFASVLDAAKAGSAQGVASALTGSVGSIVGLFNPLIGSLISVFGGLFASFLPNSRPNDSARAAGAQGGRGAPAIELSFTMNNSIAVNRMADLGAELNSVFENAIRTLETNVLPRLERLEARA